MLILMPSLEHAASADDPCREVTGLTLRRKRDDDLVVTGNWATFRRSAWTANFLEEINIGAVVIAPLFGKVVLVINRFDGADGFTSTTVDTLVGVDVQHAITLINAVDRAFVDACAVL
jgi:hypothetical protein